MLRKPLVLMFTIAMLFSWIVGIQLVDLVRANPLPEMYLRASIENPKNTTYSTNTVALNFSVESQNFFPYLNFSYSLDTQELKPIESITVIGHEYIPINPGIYSQTLEGSCVLSNLSEGWHNVTLYVTYYLSRGWSPVGGPTQLTNTTFNIAIPQLREVEPEPFPTMIIVVVSGVSTIVIGASLLIYLKKRP